MPQLIEPEAVFHSTTLQDIQAFVADGQEETLHLEFKTIADPRFSSRDDRKNLAKALSGFANSDGGVLVWGIETAKGPNDIDCASATAEIDNVDMLISKLNEHTGQAVSPLVEGVLHRKIASSGDRGFALSLVPVSDSGPHMAKMGEDRYYKRSGDSFYRMEHFDIEDMFGRRRKPVLGLHYSAHVEPASGDSSGRVYDASVTLGIANKGRGSAKFPYLEVAVEPPFRIDRYGVDGNMSFGMPRIAISGDGARRGAFAGGSAIRVYPSSVHEVLRLTGTVKRESSPPQSLTVTYRIAADDVASVDGELMIPIDDLAPSE